MIAIRRCMHYFSGLAALLVLGCGGEEMDVGVDPGKASYLELRNARAGSEAPMPYFDETDGVSPCPNGALIAGLACRGEFCNDLSLLCRKYTDGLDPLSRHSYGYWFSSEDQEAIKEENEGAFTSAMCCSERYCREVRMRYTKSPRLKNTGRCDTLHVTDGTPQQATCAPDSFLTRVECEGPNCRTLVMTCCFAELVPTAEPQEPPSTGE